MTVRSNGLVDRPDPEPFPFGPPSVARVLDEGLHEHPDRVALIDGDRSWTWTELDAAVERAAAGITAGTAVLWQMPNSAELVIGSLATFRAGAIWLGSAEPLDARLRGRVEAEIGPLRVIDTPQLLPDGDPTDPPSIDPHALAAITFTSGTTGTPKAVCHSQHNLLTPGLVSIEVEPPSTGERIATPLRLTIMNLFVLGPMSAFLRGSTYVVLRRTYAEGLAEDITAFGVTRLFAVPTLIFDLAGHAGIRPEQLASLDRVILGGSGADPTAIWNFFDRFEVRPTLSYGLSEAPTGVVRESLGDPIGSRRGFPLPHVDVVRDDRSGELGLRPAGAGPWAGVWSPTLGYLGEPERTQGLFRDGVLWTGDTGVIDADGAVSVTGRLSDLIIRGGKNFDPLVLEAACTASDAIAEALAVGVPSERLGQEIGLLVVPAHEDEDSLDLVEVLMQIEENADVGFPIDHLAIVEELPRNAMGKVIRVAPEGVFGAGDSL